MDDHYINKVLEGDYNSFRYFVKTYQKFAYSISFSILKERTLAEEVVQDSFIKAWKQLKSFRKDSKFQTWLGRIVINESLRAAKKEVNSVAAFNEIPITEVEVLNDSLGAICQAEQRYYIELVFEKLSPNESLALELYYLKEFSIEEILEISGWSESKTKMLLLRGRKSFYSYLSMVLKTELKEIL
jgi:RNA polymerase sigma-70 factor, ECF subfamily